MIWTYVGVGLTIFFGGVGVGVPLGMWIGNMMSAQRLLRRDVEKFDHRSKRSQPCKNPCPTNRLRDRSEDGRSLFGTCSTSNHLAKNSHLIAVC